jgi:hypothetical protein
MNQAPLIDLAERVVADTSLDAYATIRAQLPLKDLLMVAHVDDYLRAHAARGYTDVTGRELADWLRRDVLTVRPRLTGAHHAGWLVTGATRRSRHPAERPCHPYASVLPRAAVDRAIREAQMAHK